MSASHYRMKLISLVLFCLCGSTIEMRTLNHKSPRIVGGIQVRIEDHPWQVWIDEALCGGSLLSRKWVMSAAHCLNNGECRLTVMYGSNDRHKCYKEKATYCIIHENYSSETWDYDVGLIRLKGQITFWKNVKPVKLPKESDTLLEGTMLTVSGWGLVSEEASWIERLLRAVNVTVDDHYVCRKKYGTRLTSRMMCAGDHYSSKDSCNGDSGGPANLGDIQYGIVSWGEGCGRPYYPGVYTYVPAVLRWIKENSLGEL